MGNCRKGTANVETPKSIPELKIHSKSAMNDYPMSWEMGIADIGKLAEQTTSMVPKLFHQKDHETPCFESSAKVI